MPSSSEILAGLARIASDFWPVAVGWHVVLLGLLASLLATSWRPARRHAAALLALPLLSVSALAWSAHNPFNGVLPAAGAVLLAAFGLRLDRTPVARGPAWAVALGAASVTFGALYPHFLDARPAYFYLFAAPMGLIPCPTLAVVLGLGLVAGGFGSRAWSLTAAALGLFYALFGMLRLGVWLDVGLLVSATAMLARALQLAPSDGGALLPPPAHGRGWG